MINSCWWEASTKAQHSSIIYIMCVKKSARVGVHLVAHSHLTTRLQQSSGGLFVLQNLLDIQPANLG